MAERSSIAVAPLSWAALDGELAGTRVRQQGVVVELREARADQELLRRQLDADLAQLSKLMPKTAETERDGFLARVFGWFTPRAPEHAVEELLRRQFEQCSVNLQKAARLSDRLEVIRGELADEISRLNGDIVGSARHVETLAEELVALESDHARVRRGLLDASPGTASMREQEATLDHLSRSMAEASVQLKLYATREERLTRLREHSRMLSTTIANLATDTRIYVGAASEKLDLIGTQIQAIGAAADAAAVMLDLKRSLEIMTDSMNEAARFVSEVQLFFHDHVDSMVDNLELYDAQTRAALSLGLELSGRDEVERIKQGMRLARSTLSARARGRTKHLATGERVGVDGADESER